jgi:hypothetical protein
MYNPVKKHLMMLSDIHHSSNFAHDLGRVQIALEGICPMDPCRALPHPDTATYFEAVAVQHIEGLGSSWIFPSDLQRRELPGKAKAKAKEREGTSSRENI